MKNADLIVEKNQSIKIAMEKILINDLRIVFVVENKKIIENGVLLLIRNLILEKNIINNIIKIIGVITKWIIYIWVI